MPDSPLGRISYPGLGLRPVTRTRPKIRFTPSGTECGREVQVCTDVPMGSYPGCIYDQPTYPPSLGDGLTYSHRHSPWFEDDASFAPCNPTPVTIPPDPGSPTMPNIPTNCVYFKEPKPDDGNAWEVNHTDLAVLYPDQAGYSYSFRKCWRCQKKTLPPLPDIVIKREPPSIGYTRVPIDLNMVYEINESEKGYPTEKWSLDPATIAGGLGVQPGPSNNPMSIHYPCPIYGRKSIAKYAKYASLFLGTYWICDSFHGEQHHS